MTYTYFHAAEENICEGNLLIYNEGRLFYQVYKKKKNHIILLDFNSKSNILVPMEFSEFEEMRFLKVSHSDW